MTEKLRINDINVKVYFDKKSGNYASYCLVLGEGSGVIHKHIERDHNFTHRVTEVMFVSQNDKYYIYTSSANSSRFGQKVDKEVFEKLIKFDDIDYIESQID